MLDSTNTFGKFEFRPLEPGFGITVGNALRRILLSSLEGFAINTVRISGVEHEFSTVPGVKEDVTNIFLNLKQVRFRQAVDGEDTEKVSISVSNATEFKAGDIQNYLSGFEVLNSDLVICHLDPRATLDIELTINKGRGYVPADENREYCKEVSQLAIDSIYTPIRNVKFAVVGRGGGHQERRAGLEVDGAGPLSAGGEFDLPRPVDRQRARRRAHASHEHCLVARALVSERRLASDGADVSMELRARQSEKRGGIAVQFARTVVACAEKILYPLRSAVQVEHLLRLAHMRRGRKRVIDIRPQVSVVGARKTGLTAIEIVVGALENEPTLSGRMAA